ncbi:hypothetical protein FOCC_FOCC015287 [Frankliniella occidentalis]|nr:hypothetical protein FOCC_FOCC015287 [Frankliniella occidentalis]
MAQKINDYPVPGEAAAGDCNHTVINKQCEKKAKGELCLDLSNQSLSEVSLDIATKPQHLQFLFLQSNLIKRLPTNFFLGLPNLRHLDLRENKLFEIPTSIAGHDSLEVLLLQNNKLPALPCELGQVPRLRKLQFSGNPISWPPITILSKGLDTILSFLRGAYMEQLSQGVVDIIPKANDYVVSNFFKECTKDGEDCVNIASSDATNSSQSQTSLSLYGEKFVPQSSILFESLKERRSKPNAQELKEKSVNKLILLQGNSKQLKNRGPTLKTNTSTKDIKGPSLQPIISAGHAQAIMNGQSFPLGYRKRTASPSTTKIYKTLLKKLWLNQLKCVLQSQDQALQKQKTSEALKQWRQEARALKESASHHNWSGKMETM